MMVYTLIIPVLLTGILILVLIFKTIKKIILTCSRLYRADGLKGLLKGFSKFAAISCIVIFAAMKVITFIETHWQLIGALGVLFIFCIGSSSNKSSSYNDELNYRFFDHY